MYIDIDSLFQRKNIAPVLENFNAELCCNIDLSAQNKALLNTDLANVTQLHDFIFNHITAQKAQFGIGGYLEKRIVYKVHEHFKNSKEPERNIHLGIDIWAPAGAKIFAPINGTVHSFAFNNTKGDYGATIILQHEVKGFSFHTLYGHLSLNSIANLKEGQAIEARQQLAQLGNHDENGGWPPHLHFQIILDMQGKKGDYAGVCAAEDLTFFSLNCPNPTILLGLK